MSTHTAMFKLTSALAVAIELINTIGFKARKEGEQSTAVQVGDKLTSGEKLSTFVSKESNKLGKAALAWFRGDLKEPVPFQAANDFDNACADVALRDKITPATLGIVAAMARAFLIATQTPSNEQNVTGTGENVGEINSVIELSLKVLASHDVTNDYGTSVRHLCRDESGNDVLYWARKGSAMPVFPAGSEINVRALVQKHGEYNGRKQTTITQVALVGDNTAPAISDDDLPV